MGDLRNAQLPDEQIYDVDEASDKVDPAKLAAVIDRARYLMQADRRVAAAEKELRAAKDKRTVLASQELPKLMKDAGLTEAPLGNGWSIELDTMVTASVPSPTGKAENAAERHAKGIAYLDIVAPDIPKYTATISFGRDNVKQLNKLLTNVRKYKPPMEVVVAASVHAGTLGKWVRAQDKAGKAVDEEALGVVRMPTAELVAPKTDKGGL